jgi:hypothetical protein
MRIPVQVKMEALGKCPCGQNIYSSLNPPAVAHDAPHCVQFEMLAPTEFLTWVRRSRGISDTESGATNEPKN